MFAGPQGFNISQGEACISPGIPTAVDQKAVENTSKFLTRG